MDVRPTTGPKMAAGAAVRCVALPSGGRIVIRGARADDVPGLVALYHRLPLEDRYRRFFTAFEPDAAFFQRMLARSAQGGVALVAVLVTGSDERVVAEATCIPVDDGDGELAIAIDREWRGWLAPYLLDALLDEARLRGIPNLEAEVLAVNGPMLALARARGGAVLDEGDDLSTTRILIGAERPAPTWPPRSRALRLLVEGTMHWRGSRAAAAAGFDVIACPGPRRRGAVPCPALRDETCPLVDGAGAVVVAMGAGDEARAVVAAALAHRPARPVLVDRQRWGPEPVPEGCITLDPADRDELARDLVDLARVLRIELNDESEVIT